MIWLCAIVMLGLLGCGSDHHGSTLSWDTNPEPDMKEYRVYTGADDLFMVTPHIAEWDRQHIAIPNEPRCYFVVAVDQSDNVSEPSVWACVI